ncbi:MAG: DNA-3-methyladenine glycosylase [Dysgonamonadaceae bacterium]|nr:DNA-3-methyladenine glycosylase [Dysgonamonadaceae bacterium]MDD4727134.1 DNA-3-methyladenine glycosylase [Dysgonamonadaceae bacterium]
MPKIFIYGEKEIEYLKKVDPTLGAIIDQVGPIERVVISDLFTALVNSIVGQQISSKAMDTVWGRFEKRFPQITPKALYNTSLDEIQQCGMSMRKANYIKEAASKVLSGELDIDELYTLSEEEVIEKLSALHGVGVWTAEMIMIFCMQRPNIMSWGDLAIQRGLRMLYHHRKIDKKLFQKYKRRYSPYASVASLYLWEISGGAGNLIDYAPKLKKNKK